MRDVDIEELNANEMLLDSMLFRMIQISENAKKLTDEYKQSHRYVPWNALSGMRNLFDNEYDDFDGLHNMENSRSKDLLRVFMEDEMNRAAGKVAPDTTGVDKYFIDGFFYGDLNYDFWVIARDFMNHHFSMMPEFDKLASYMNGGTYLSSPDEDYYIDLVHLSKKMDHCRSGYSR